MGDSDSNDGGGRRKNVYMTRGPVQVCHVLRSLRRRVTISSTDLMGSGLSPFGLHTSLVTATLESLVFLKCGLGYWACQYSLQYLVDDVDVVL